MIRFVRSAVPKLPIATSEVKTNGWDNDILIINKQQVFRFPKTDQITDHNAIMNSTAIHAIEKLSI